jgi:hypothetical protein
MMGGCHFKLEFDGGFHCGSRLELNFARIEQCEGCPLAGMTNWDVGVWVREPLTKLDWAEYRGALMELWIERGQGGPTQMVRV